MICVRRFSVVGLVSLWLLMACNDDQTGSSAGDGTEDTTEVADSNANLEVGDEPDIVPDRGTEDPDEPDVEDTSDEGEDVADVVEIEDAVEEEATPFVFGGACPDVDTGAAIGFGPIDTDAHTIEIHMRHCEEVAAFQFDLIGAEISDASGGRAEAAFGTLTANNPPDIEGGRVVAIDLGGATMSPTVGDDTLLVVLQYTPVVGFDEVCMQQVVVSSPGSEPHRLELNIGDCASPI